MLDNMLFKEYTKQKARMFNPLQLAIIGDAVYEVCIRNYIFNGNQGLSAHKIHIEAIKYVKAKAQSDLMLIIDCELTEEERYIFKRGRNTKSATVPKNANVRDYRAATGMEALVGYLYLTNQHERLENLIKLGIESLEV